MGQSGTHGSNLNVGGSKLHMWVNVECMGQNCMHGSNLNRRCTKSCHGVTASIRGGRLKNF